MCFFFQLKTWDLLLDIWNIQIFGSSINIIYIYIGLLASSIWDLTNVLQMNLHHTKRDKPALISKWPTNTETFVAFGFIFTVFRAHFFEKHAKSGQQSWYTTWFQGNVRPLANCESKSGLSQFFQGLILVRLQDSKNHRKVTPRKLYQTICHTSDPSELDQGWSSPIFTFYRLRQVYDLWRPEFSVPRTNGSQGGGGCTSHRGLMVEYVGSQEKHVQDIIFLWESPTTKISKSFRTNAFCSGSWGYFLDVFGNLWMSNSNPGIFNHCLFNWRVLQKSARC